MIYGLILAISIAQAPDAKLVIEAGKQIKVQSIMTGQYNQVVQDEAQKYAMEMAFKCQQDGHAGWDNRFARLSRRFPGVAFFEITAESWPGQSNKESAPELFNSWRQSSGHWRVANGRCRLYGYAMARGRNNVYYGVGIIGR